MIAKSYYIIQEVARSAQEAAALLPQVTRIVQKQGVIAMADEIQERIDETVRATPVVLFMKGTRQSPQCGFSATVIGILQQLGTDFSDVNVLDDDRLREGIKAYSNWPTVPQLYINGAFVGGCDIVREMYEAGELEEPLAKARLSDSGASA
jgi:monothiol glutaredoxin